MIHLIDFSKGFSFRSLLALAIALASQPLAADGSWLEVRLVQAQDGKPLADASVCLGTQARADQFGARRSDARGVVRFEDIRPHALLLTTSMRGFQGREQLLEPQYQSRVLMVKMVTGGGGPTCNAPASATADAATSSLAIDAVRVRKDVNAGAGGVLVTARVSGQANQIRISEAADFKGADWQVLGPAVNYALSEGKGLKRLYIQVRRASEVEGASLEVLSPVKEVSYRLN